jgi:hypothetical protein
VQFFVDFWGKLGEGLREHEPDKARVLSERLAALLEQELLLETFFPVLYQAALSAIFLHRREQFFAGFRTFCES